ncbi:MAG: tetratricopeptide repeat protein [Terracidiphilus sp.]
MKMLRHDCFTSATTVAWFGAAILLMASMPAKAVDPDIPPMQPKAERDSVSREIDLAAAYLTGRGVPQNEKQAAYWYEKAAEAGDPEAQKEIGYFYQIGLGVPVDPARAVHWYQLSAAGGLLSGKVNLGVAYVWGIGVPRNTSLGAQLFREAAEKGSGLGACYLGDMYYLGIGVKQDLAAAEHWFEIGTKLHEARAAFRLGSLLSTNQEHAQNLPKAAELLRKSTEEGYVPAMHALGLLLVNHPELAKSPNEAIALLDEASNAGNWKSTATLGVLARDGSGVPLDNESAYYHFRVATLQGGDPARQLLENDLKILAVKLGTANTEKVDGAAKIWFQQHQQKLQRVYKGGENWGRFPAFALAVPEDGAYAGKLILKPIGASNGQPAATDQEMSTP